MFYLILAKAANGTPSKKAKVEKFSPEFRWEFEGDNKKWMQYSEALNNILTEAFNKDEPKVRKW